MIVTLLAIFVLCSNIWSCDAVDMQNVDYHLVSVEGEGKDMEFKLFNMHRSVLAHRFRIEQTTGMLLEIIGKTRLSPRKHILPRNFITVDNPNLADWMYDMYLISETLELIRSRLPSVGHVNSDFLAVKSILNSNCGDHQTAVLLARAIVVYLTRLNRLTEARQEAASLRMLSEESLRTFYCFQCSTKRTIKPAPLLAWRAWLSLGLFDLISSDKPQAERDLTIALDLITAIQLGEGLIVAQPIMGMVRYVKAIADHNANKFLDAMELAVLNAHLNPSTVDAVLFISQTMTRYYMFRRALNMLNLLLPLIDAYGPNYNLVEHHTDLPTLKRLTLQLRSWVLYRLGDIQGAQTDSQSCLDILPTDAFCAYVKATCMLVVGNFVEAVKSTAPILSQGLNDHVRESPEMIQLAYLKEWARYLHRHIEQPMSQFHWLNSLTSSFKHSWSRLLPIHSLTNYVEQPGINSELPNLLQPPHLIDAILHKNKTNQTSGTADSIHCAQNHGFMSQTSPKCIDVQLKDDGELLCKLDVTFRLVLPVESNSGASRWPSLNQRHRLALALGSLHSADMIRNSWCKRRRVSFDTCWSHPPGDTTRSGRLCTRPTTMSYASEQGPIHPSGDCFQSAFHAQSDSERPLPDGKSHRTPHSGDSPDWLVQTSLITQLMLLADPSDTPSIWLSGSVREDLFDTSDTTQRQPGVRESDRIDRAKRNEHHSPTSNGVNHSQRSLPAESSADVDPQTGIVDELYLIIEGQPLPETATYLPTAVHLMHSLMQVHSIIDPTTQGDRMKILADAIVDEDPVFDEYFQGSESVDKLPRVMDRLWKEAKRYNLVNQFGSVAFNLFVSGVSSSTEPVEQRYLAAVLLMKQNKNAQYTLSVLYLSDRINREGLNAQLDAVFVEFLTRGEKALATILAGSNTQSDLRRGTSPLNDHYLRSAVKSAFTWFYYWIVLKPVNSDYNLHIGFGMLLGMLRSLGVEPKIGLTHIERDITLEALFLGSPEPFVALCFELFSPDWLSQSSMELMWLVTPDAWFATPKDFIELLNLQMVNKCYSD